METLTRQQPAMLAARPIKRPAAVVRVDYYCLECGRFVGRAGVHAIVRPFCRECGETRPAAIHAKWLPR